jgi:hypothetical protein
MNDDTPHTDTPHLPAIQNRIITAAVEIAEADPLEVVYQHSLFCQVALPRSRPQGRTFERSYRNGLLRMEAGALWDGRKMVDQPLPAGPKPRLALMHINSQAVKTRSPYIDIGKSCAEFLQRLGLNHQDGRTYAQFKREMQALAVCRMTLGFTKEDGRAVTLDTKPITRFEAWFATNDDAPALWPSELQLGQEYFESLREHAVPLDSRAVAGLAHSATALDTYSFLARRLYTLQKPVKVTWHQFHGQFGQEYQDWRSFKKKFIPAVRAALALYPSAKVEEVTGGLMLHPSLPPVHSRSVAVSHGLAAQVSKTLADPTAKNLHPVTIEQFRTIYPRLDPYTCKGAFDTWLAGKEPPRSYDKAFMGFARKWVKGKG